MKYISCELEKLDTYQGIEYAQRIIELFNDFPDNYVEIGS